MSAADQLYGLYVIYNGLSHASQISSKPTTYLETCAKSLIPIPADFNLSDGVKAGQAVSLSLQAFKFDEKFMSAVEKHLIDLEEEVPEFYASQIVKLEPKKKLKKRCRFNDVHKKSIIVEHIKSGEWTVGNCQEKKSLYYIYKRRPRA